MQTDFPYQINNKSIKKKIKTPMKRQTPTKKRASMKKRSPMKKQTRIRSNTLVKKHTNKSSQNDILPCYLIDSHYAEPTKVNETWHTCIGMNGIKNRIIYITSQNIFIKSIESFQIPVFNVTLLPEALPVHCNIMIEDKFVGCFLNVYGEWYVVMRLFGKTLNTGVLARTEKNKAYYKIKNIQIDASVSKNGEVGLGRVVGTSSITIPENYYEEVNPSFRLLTSNSRVIRIKSGCFQNINKTNSVFKVIQRFRQEKIIANTEKNDFIQDVIFNSI